VAPHPIPRVAVDPLPEPSVAAAKAALRRAALERRDAIPAATRAQACEAIAARVLALPELARAACVAAYWPIRSEVDPRPILAGLHARGQATALPVVTPRGLVFRAFAPGDRLVRAGFGLSEPSGEALEVRPDALLVPLAAFDAAGRRLGYGAGYYDGAIAALAPRLTIGLAFAAQGVDAVPTEAHDRSLDRIATEDAMIVPTEPL
jgi:5-formyltetrahydrofolate cyclo-ligase